MPLAKRPEAPHQALGTVHSKRVQAVARRSEEPIGLKVKSALDSLARTVRFIARQRRKTRIESFEELAEFLGTRSAYIAQTSLYGYLKTRMGTQFTRYFEDDEFSRSIHQAATRLYASCLSDLTVHSVAVVSERATLTREGARELAENLYLAALHEGVSERDRVLLPDDAVARFRERLARTVWESEASGTHAFWGSIEDLVRYAPVIDEFREADSEIVMNSIRFRWRDVREQLRKRLMPEEVVASTFRP